MLPTVIQTVEMIFDNFIKIHGKCTVVINHWLPWKSILCLWERFLFASKSNIGYTFRVIQFLSQAKCTILWYPCIALQESSNWKHSHLTLFYLRDSLKLEFHFCMLKLSCSDVIIARNFHDSSSIHQITFHVHVQHPKTNKTLS